MYRLTDALLFPSPEQASDEGIVAVGGDLKPERVMLAYRKGIFPGLNLMTFSSGGAQTLGWSCFQIKSKSRKACAQSCEKNSLK